MGAVLITGANRGIGLEFAVQYAEAGVSVIAACRAPEDAAALQRLKESHGGVSIEPLDVTDQASAHALADRLESAGTTLDLLINNAGILRHAEFGRWLTEDFALTFATNVAGPATVAQALAKLIPEGGKIINVSSGLGAFSLELGLGGSAASYAASKAALNMMTAHMGSALKSRGVIVAAFSPGWVKTEMGGMEAELEPVDSVAALRRSIAALSVSDTGKFFDYRGGPLAW